VGIVLELEDLFRKVVRADYVRTAVATLRYGTYNILTSFVGVSNYDSANAVLTACRRRLVQRHIVKFKRNMVGLTLFTGHEGP
jgi:hypothetical protein